MHLYELYMSSCPLCLHCAHTPAMYAHCVNGIPYEGSNNAIVLSIQCYTGIASSQSLWVLTRRAHTTTTGHQTARLVAWRATPNTDQETHADPKRDARATHHTVRHTPNMLEHIVLVPAMCG